MISLALRDEITTPAEFSKGGHKKARLHFSQLATQETRQMITGILSLFRSKDFKQAADLVIDFVWPVDGLGNFAAEQITIVPSQTVRSHFHSRLTNSQLIGGCPVGFSPFGTRNEPFQLVKVIYFLLVHEFLPEPFHDACQQGDCPLSFEEPFGGQRVDRLNVILRLS
jgi:hypothetical protein